MVALKKSKNSISIRIMLYISITISATILMISAVQYIYSRDNSIQQISKFYRDYLKQVSYSTDFMATSARNLISQLYLDSDVSPLLYNSTPDEQEINIGLRRLGTFTACLDFIQSIYIYNGANKTFYTTVLNENIVKENNFFDKDLLARFKTTENFNVSRPIARKIFLPDVPNDDRNYTNLFSFLYYEKSPEDLVDTAIVVNVSEKWLSGVMNSINSLKSANLLIIDDQGNILSSNSSNNNIVIPADATFINKVLDSASSSGYFIDKMKNTDFFVTYISIEELNWKFIGITPCSEIVEQSNKLLIREIFISFIALLLGILLSIIMSKRISTPITSLIAKLEQQNSQSMEQKNELKSLFLIKLLHNDIFVHKGTIEQLLEQHKINLPVKKEVVLVLLRIDGFKEFCMKLTASDRTLMKFAIMNITSEILSQFDSNEAVDIEEDHVVHIVSFGDCLDKRNLENLKNLIFEAQSAIEKHLHLSVTAVVSSSGYLEKGLEDLYNKALDASNYRLRYGWKSIILSNDIPIQDAGSDPFPQEKVKLLTDSLMLGKMESAKSLFDEVMKSINGYSYSVFKSTLSRLIANISTVLENFENTSGIHTSHDLNTFINSVQMAETLEQIYCAMEVLLNKLDNILAEKKNNKHIELIDNIMKIIEKNYGDESLCLDSIAQSVGMSTLHIGRIFKRYTTKSVSSAINETRMKIAKNLLKTSDKQINEIVKKTGFPNSKYFYTIFKRENGITPNEYRISMRKEKLEES